MKLVIHQPYFLPWLGFFSKIGYADGYVSFDDAQLRKRYFHDRVKIVSMSGEIKWLGIPTGDHLGVRLNEVVLRDMRFMQKIVRTIEHSYVRARHFQAEWPPLKELLESMEVGTTLSDLNLLLIRHIMSSLFPDREIPCWLSSSIPYEGDVTDRIISVCKRLGATSIIMGRGASLSPSVHDLDRIRDNSIRIFCQDFLAANLTYFQVRRQRLHFAPGVSSIDAILNIGSFETSQLLSASELVPSEVE